MQTRPIAASPPPSLSHEHRVCASAMSLFGEIREAMQHPCSHWHEGPNPEQEPHEVYRKQATTAFAAMGLSKGDSLGATQPDSSVKASGFGTPRRTYHDNYDRRVHTDFWNNLNLVGRPISSRLDNRSTLGESNPADL